MYAAGQLTVHPFFRDLLKEVSLPQVLDSLTGLVSRPFILRYIQHLINEGTPFALALIDLDNFKDINDHCGHRIGDSVLSMMAAKLIDFFGSDGLVGRFGGDEFLAVYLKSTQYDAVREVYLDLNRRVFRRDLMVDGLPLYMTATVGSAAFPKDAGDYDTLFSLIDKTLYRGKYKGRNCFIIYVKEKHQDLEIPRLARHSLYETLRQMEAGFEAGEDFISRLKGAFAPMREKMHLQGLLYMDGGGRLMNVEAGETLAVLPGAAESLCGEMRLVSGLEKIETSHPELCVLLRERRQQSVMIQPVAEGRPEPGLLVFCPEKATRHIWQDEECAAAFVLSRMAYRYLKTTGEAFAP